MVISTSRFLRVVGRVVLQSDMSNILIVYIYIVCRPDILVFGSPWYTEMFWHGARKLLVVQNHFDFVCLHMRFDGSYWLWSCMSFTLPVDIIFMWRLILFTLYLRPPCCIVIKLFLSRRLSAHLHCCIILGEWDVLLSGLLKALLLFAVNLGRPVILVFVLGLPWFGRPLLCMLQFFWNVQSSF